MKTFLLTVSSPDGDVFKGSVCKISLRGTEGELAVMAGHIPFVTAVVPCEVKIYFEDDSVKTARVQGGILNVSADSVTFISGTFIWN